MIGFIHHVSRLFWNQYPLGTELTYTYVFRQFNLNRVMLCNALGVLATLFFNSLTFWNRILVPHLISQHRNVLLPLVPPGYVAKVAYYAVFSPILWSLIALISVVLLIPFLALMTALSLFAFAFIGIWTVFVVLLFISWFGLHRYPIYEILYPKIRRWMQAQNSGVYSALPRQITNIRTIRLKRGEAREPIECDLVTEPLSGATFEALSYVWGTTLVPYKISVNDSPFYVTYNLYCALKQLRHMKNDRVLWIDAICINQRDSTEKGSQVQIMRDIYAKASRVVVWLGKESIKTTAVLGLLQQYKAVRPEYEDAWWMNFVGSSEWKTIWPAIYKLAEHDWWHRAWIIQEVVMGKHVVVQIGSHQADWQDLSHFLASEPCIAQFPILSTALFARNIQDLRLELQGDSAIPKSLFQLVYQFRGQSATFGPDKIYALLGLLKVDNPTLLVPDYDKSSAEVFLEFTLAWLEHQGNLTVIALAPGTELEGVSWCRDWRLTHDGQFEAMHLNACSPTDEKDYSASGSLTPVFKTDLSRRILSLKGYEVDKVIRSGDFVQQFGFDPIDWFFQLPGWEYVAGGPWEEGSLYREAFTRTITAEHWVDGLMDWRQYVQRRDKPPRRAEDEWFIDCLTEVATCRCFFVTESGRFGLGPWNLRTGDKVCILLGGKTPFLLRPYAPLCKSTAETKFHKVIGEVFVDGLMYYQGKMEDDIKSGKVLPMWYHLR